jgi:diguanylate cyclase (GGDEF)-like protein
MNEESIKVLVVDDNQEDFEIVRELLSSTHNQSFKLDWSSNVQDALRILGLGEHHVCLLDYRLGQDLGLNLIEKSQQMGSQIPFILLTGAEDYEVDVEAMRMGAFDFLSKKDLNTVRLERSIRYALERAKAEQAIREQEEQLSNIRSEKLLQERNMFRQQALTDPLTLLWNRRAIIEFLQLEMKKASQTDIPLGLIMADLDYFKIVNDTYGHTVGDLVLLEAAHRIQSCLRENDNVDEFLIVMPGADISLATKIAERIRATMAVKNIITPRGIHSVAVSLGVGVAPKNKTISPEVFISQVDKCLYEAKGRGRNTVCQFIPD